MQPNPAHLSLGLSVSQTASVPGLHVEGGREVDMAQGMPVHTNREQGRHDSLMTLAFVHHIILPIICISFMWDSALRRKVSSLLA